MAFLDDLTKKAQAYAEVAAVKGKEAAGIVSEKAKAVADNAKLSVAIVSEQHEIEKNYRAIGEWFVSEYKDEVPEAVKDVVDAIEASKVRIAELEAQKDKKEDEAADVTLKVCPVCGATSDGKFCPKCGAPMGE
jgi:rubrerythrin